MQLHAKKAGSHNNPEYYVCINLKKFNMGLRISPSKCDPSIYQLLI